MSRFKYNLDIGGYQDPVRIDISLEVEGGLNTTDYASVREALAIVERIGREYEQKAIQRNIKQTESTASEPQAVEAQKEVGNMASWYKSPGIPGRRSPKGGRN